MRALNPNFKTDGYLCLLAAILAQALEDVARGVQPTDPTGERWRATVDFLCDDQMWAWLGLDAVPMARIEAAVTRANRRSQRAGYGQGAVARTHQFA